MLGRRGKVIDSDDEPSANYYAREEEHSQYYEDDP